MQQQQQKKKKASCCRHAASTAAAAVCVPKPAAALQQTRKQQRPRVTGLSRLAPLPLLLVLLQPLGGALANRLETLRGFENNRVLGYEPSFVDGYPYPITAPSGDINVFCLLPKVASSRLKAFLTAASGVPLPQLYEWSDAADSIHEAVYPYFRTNMKLYSERVFNSSLPRFIVVRNPYVRLLSAYLDKYLGDAVHFSFPDKLDFPSFVDALYNEWRDNGYRFPPAADERGQSRDAALHPSGCKASYGTAWQ